MKKMILINDAFTIIKRHPTKGQIVEVYQSPSRPQSYRVIGYEIDPDGLINNFRKHRFVEPNFTDTLTEELVEKWEYQEQELAKEQRRELKPVFTTKSDF